MISVRQLNRFFPKAKPEIIRAIVDQAPKVLVSQKLTTPARLCDFFAHVSVETGGLTRLDENLNYRAAQLCLVWPARFGSLAAAAPFAHHPEALANKVYGGRLGNAKPGDGWKYRGQGLIQTTGAYNFKRLQNITGVPLLSHPELVMSPAHMLECAAILYGSLGAIPFADRGDILGSTRKINGGTTGFTERRAAWFRARRVFT